MKTKYCYKCKQERPKKGFYRRGLCKSCGRKMPKVFITEAYMSQRTNCKTRDMPQPTYTREELQTWLITKTNFKELYLAWKRSGYDKYLKPSVDRINENESYSLDNIQLMTWKENKLKGEQSCKEGKRYHLVRSVCSFDLETEELVEQYYSLHEAYRQTGIRYNTIWSATNKTNQHNGKKLGRAKNFKWQFTLDYLKNTIQDIDNQERDLQTNPIKPSQIHYNEDTCLVSISK